jgi:PEP-CTERM motif
MRLRFAIFTTLLMILPFPAFADIITTFTLQDVTFEQPSFGENPSATGTLTFDDTTQRFNAVDVMVGFGSSPIFEFNSIANNEFSSIISTSYAGASMTQGSLEQQDYVQLVLVWDGLAAICTETNISCNDGSSLTLENTVSYAKTGYVTGTTTLGPPPAPMPEPSTIVLFSSGILGLIAMAYRRRAFLLRTFVAENDQALLGHVFPLGWEH